MIERAGKIRRRKDWEGGYTQDTQGGLSSLRLRTREEQLPGCGAQQMIMAKPAGEQKQACMVGQVARGARASCVCWHTERSQACPTTAANSAVPSSMPLLTGVDHVWVGDLGVELK